MRTSKHESGQYGVLSCFIGDLCSLSALTVDMFLVQAFLLSVTGLTVDPYCRCLSRIRCWTNSWPSVVCIYLYNWNMVDKKEDTTVSSDL